MPANLLIVESPSKAKPLKKYLGADFEVLASYGHVRDLVPKNGAVDPEHDFAMKYQIIAKNAKHVDAIASAPSPNRATAGSSTLMAARMRDPVCMGFVMCVSPRSCDLLWERGAPVRRAAWMRDEPAGCNLI